MVDNGWAPSPTRAERLKVMSRVVGAFVEATVKVAAAMLCVALLMGALQRAAARS